MFKGWFEPENTNGFIGSQYGLVYKMENFHNFLVAYRGGANPLRVGGGVSDLLPTVVW